MAYLIPCHNTIRTKLSLMAPHQQEWTNKHFLWGRPSTDFL